MVRKLSNKGITLIELIVSFALVGVAIIYFYQTLYTVKKLYSESQKETKEFVNVNYAYRIIDELNKTCNQENYNLCKNISEYKNKDSNFLVDNCKIEEENAFKNVMFKINGKDYSMYFYNETGSSPIIPPDSNIENLEESINSAKDILLEELKINENDSFLEQLELIENDFGIEFNSFTKTNIDGSVSDVKFWLLEEMDVWILAACNNGDLKDEWCNIFKFSDDVILKLQENLQNKNNIYCIFNINGKYAFISDDEEFNLYLNDYYIEMLDMNYTDYLNEY